MLKTKFIKISEDQDFYEEEFLNYYDGEEEKAYGYFQYYLEQFLERITRITETNEGISVWRMIKVDDPSQINTEVIGGSWSYKKDAAHCWYGGSINGENYLIEGILPLDSINLEVTLRQNLVNPDEEELRLNSDSIILISKITTKDGLLVKEFNPPIQSSSGKIGDFGDWNG